MYKITIEEVKEADVESRGLYEVLRYEFLSVDEKQALENKAMCSKEVDYLREFKFKKDSGNYRRIVMGYTPNVQVKEELKIKVLEQTVEKLDVAAVIKAVNGL